MKEVLIAHQSTIPHYRIPFYNALERLRPASWRFEVVFDPSDKKRAFFEEQLENNPFAFRILEVQTLLLRRGVKKISYQTFLSKIGKYDLVIIEHAVNNLAYPLCHLRQLTGGRLAYWGLGRDMEVEVPSFSKSLTEKLKIFLAQRADGYFAYTAGVKSYLEGKGLDPQKIFILNNTIDVNEQREVFKSYIASRETIRQEMHLQGKKVLLFVGRFTKDKRIDFLLKAFSNLCKKKDDFHLLLVGSKGEFCIPDNARNVSFLGPIVDLDKLGPIQVASDVFVLPGGIGLGPLQAFCYDLPVITVEFPFHGPEFEYLSPANAIVLPFSTTEEEYAQAVFDLFEDNERLHALRATVWPSVQHLTIEQMAGNFIEGVNFILSH